MDVTYGYLCEVRSTFEGPHLDNYVDVTCMLGHTAETYESFYNAAQALGGGDAVPNAKALAAYMSTMELRSRMNPDTRVLLIKSKVEISVEEMQTLLSTWAKHGALAGMMERFRFDMPLLTKHKKRKKK